MKKTAKLIVALLSCVCLVASAMAVFTVSTAATTASYVKVTEAPADWSGDYLIVYEDGANSRVLNGGAATLDAEGNYITAAIVDGAIEANATTNAAKFTIAKSGSNYTIKTADGKYIGNTGSQNKLLNSTSTVYTNVLTLQADGSVDVKASDGNSYLRCNIATTNGNRFRYYKSTSYTNQKPIALYKYVETTATETTTTTQTPAATGEEIDLGIGNTYRDGWAAISEKTNGKVVDFTGKKVTLVYNFTLADFLSLSIRNNVAEIALAPVIAAAEGVSLGGDGGDKLPAGTYEGSVEVTGLTGEYTLGITVGYGPQPDLGYGAGATAKLVVEDAPATTTEATTTTTTQAAALTPVEIIDAVFAGGTMDDVTLTGKVVSIDTAYSSQYGNITVSIAVEGREDKALKCYRLAGDGVDQIAVGDTITVQGNIVQYSSKPQFAQGCQMTNRVSGGGTIVTAPADQKEIVDALYALTDGQELPYEGTLTGTVTEIDTPYDSGYKNVSVVITVEGRETKPVLVFRMKGTGADTVKVGDIITVTGNFKNYGGTFELVNGQLQSVQAGATTTTVAGETTTTTVAGETTTTTAQAGGEGVPAGDVAPFAFAGLAIVSAAALIVVSRKK